MAKKNGGKVIQMLSPENYIRQKARTLPVYECVVNDEWEDSRMVQLSVARQHTNGNVTVCFYLVDLMCLGVKDTHFMFNVSKTEYREQFEHLDGRMAFENISYELAHNLVYAGLEFAEDYGFKPHKDFTSVTRFMLEEDTEDIELIEIECGMNGKPAYMRGPFDDDAKIQRILAQLERTAGPGNYTFVDADDDFDEFGDGEYDDEFDGMSVDEKKEKFMNLCSRIDELDTDSQQMLGALGQSLLNEFIDIDLHDKYYDEFFEKLNADISENPFEDHLLGIIPGERVVTDELKNRFVNLYQLIFKNQEQAKKELKEFEKDSQGLPGAYFLELQLLQIRESRKFSKRLKEYALKYPAYSLIRLMYATDQVVAGKDLSKIQGYPFTLDTFFPGRETIHPMEHNYFITLHLFLTARENDLTKTEAFYSVLDEFDLTDNDYETLSKLTTIIKFEQLIKVLTQ